MKRTLLLTAIAFSLGCVNLRFNRAEHSPPAGHQVEYKARKMVFGFVPLRSIPPLDTICGSSRFESAEMKMNAGDVLLTMVTLGIYVPQRVAITCR